MTSVAWLDLPEECLALVFGVLPVDELAKSRLVCTHWARVALITRAQVHIRRPLTG